MEWNEGCEHGIKWQDEQHKLLLKNINALFDSVLMGSSDEDAFLKTIKFLEKYSEEHFRQEEFFMHKHGYPRQENHINEHRNFTEDLKKLTNGQHYTGIESSVELVNKLNNWFFEHTQTTDKYLAQFLCKYEK